MFKLWNLSLIYEIMMICEKKLDTLSIGSLPTATMLSRFWPKKVVLSTGTKKASKDLCFGT